MSDFLKFLLRLILYFIFIAILFTAISLWRGGDWIRYTGNIIYRASEEAAKTSDSIYNCRREAERFCGKVKRKVMDIFKKDGDSDKGK